MAARQAMDGVPSDTSRSEDRSDAPVLIGIDVGTSSVRAIAFDARGRRLAAGARPTPIRIVDTGGEYDPDAALPLRPGEGSRGDIRGG